MEEDRNDVRELEQILDSFLSKAPFSLLIQRDDIVGALNEYYHEKLRAHAAAWALNEEPKTVRELIAAIEQDFFSTRTYSEIESLVTAEAEKWNRQYKDAILDIVYNELAQNGLSGKYYSKYKAKKYLRGNSFKNGGFFSTEELADLVNINILSKSWLCFIRSILLNPPICNIVRPAIYIPDKSLLQKSIDINKSVIEPTKRVISKQVDEIFTSDYSDVLNKEVYFDVYLRFEEKKRFFKDCFIWHYDSLRTIITYQASMCKFIKINRPPIKRPPKKLLK